MVLTVALLKQNTMVSNLTEMITEKDLSKDDIIKFRQKIRAIIEAKNNETLS